MKTFEELVKNNYHLSCKELDDFFDSLEPVNMNIFSGEWKAEYLFTKEGTGSWWEFFTKHIPIIRVYSKIFLDKNNVNALVYNLFCFKFNFPGSHAFLQQMEFRNKISTSMIYNHVPMVDHFRMVNENTLMGIMTTGSKLNLYFYIKK